VHASARGVAGGNSTRALSMRGNLPHDGHHVRMRNDAGGAVV
jgi:hypothetical protein